MSDPTPVSIVTPVYRSTATLPELVARLEAALGGRRFEIILVDDGSPEETWRIVADLAERHSYVRGLRLSRNFGQHNALLAGIRVARHSIVVTMDDDLQHPPEEVPALLAALTNDVDVVYGTSRDVAQNLWRRLASVITRRVIGTALGGENAARLTAFRAFRTDLRRAFDADVGPSVSIDALLSWSTSRFGSVEVAHAPRTEGTSNYTFRHLARHALDVSTGYSAVPLQIATALGLATALFGVGVLVWVLGRTLLTDDTAPGFPFLASTIAIFAGAQLLTLGIIGEYLARMHFRVMRKPTYVVREMAGTDTSTHAAGDSGHSGQESPTSPTPGDHPS